MNPCMQVGALLVFPSHLWEKFQVLIHMALGIAHFKREVFPESISLSYQWLLVFMSSAGDGLSTLSLNKLSMSLRFFGR